MFLQQHNQRVKAEEDFNENDVALEDDPDVDMIVARYSAVVSQLLDCCCWILYAEGGRSAHNQVEQGKKGHNRQSSNESLQLMEVRKSKQLFWFLSNPYRSELERKVFLCLLILHLRTNRYRTLISGPFLIFSGL